LEFPGLRDDNRPVITRLNASLLAALLSAAPAAATPAGYFVDRKQAAAERPIDRVEADGDFTLSIHRRYEGPVAARLLGIAEATYPPRDRLVSIAIERTFDMGSDSARVPLWWCDGRGVARVPYAITAGALEHYTKLTEHFRQHNFREAGATNLFWSDLAYKASIEPRDQYVLEGVPVRNVYVAEMILSWSYDDGTFVQMLISHRFVVLTKDGTVIAVEGDGQTDEEVSMSSHRGIGRVKTLMR
jgi:hypothetical protein